MNKNNNYDNHVSHYAMHTDSNCLCNSYESQLVYFPVTVKYLTVAILLVKKTTSGERNQANNNNHVDNVNGQF